MMSLLLQKVKGLGQKQEASATLGKVYHVQKLSCPCNQNQRDSDPNQKLQRLEKVVAQGMQLLIQIYASLNKGNPQVNQDQGVKTI